MRVLVDADFAARYERLCDAHLPRIQSVTGPERRGALLALQALGELHRSPGGNHAITVEDHPAGVEFEIFWRVDTRVEAFLSFTEGSGRCSNNFAVLLNAARSGPVPAGKPSHPRPYAGSGDELRIVVSELLAIALDVGRRYAARPGADLRWRMPAARARRMQDAGVKLAQRTARWVGPLPAAARRADLSSLGLSRATRKPVQRRVLALSAVCGLSGALPMLLLGVPFAQVLAPAAAMALVTGFGASRWLRRKLAADYVHDVCKELAGRTHDATTQLRRILLELDFQPGLMQLDSLQRQYTAFEVMLGRKFKLTELTYSRYLAMAEQVFLAGLDNLIRIVDILDGLSAIDIGYISRRIRHLESDGIDSSAQDAEIEALKKRLLLLEAQHARVSELLAENETAVTRLVQVASAIASLDPASPQAEMGMETAMRELQVLVERAPAYSQQP